ncbi:MAG: endo-1,4-beta-xylanase, partial [Phaeodactylibacter sp.]|nr:endo-1,4-beta-xylanase [Phaeodactylibacter sp.]
MTTRHLLFSLLTGLLLVSCTEAGQPEAESAAAATPSLKSAFQDDFRIGAALNAAQIKGEDPKATELLEREFNSITPENRMKWMHIHPGRDSFDFQVPDQFVALGEKNEMFVVGHTLVWHSQLAPWVSEIQDAAEMETMLEDHINTIVGRYKGRVNGWDVVNEALNEDGSLRESVFLKTLGPDYLKKAFSLAAAADPAAELYYNDYNLCEPAKREGCVALVKDLQAAGVKIDGVGIQAHFGLDYPPLEEIEKSITAFADLGLKVHFTEVDITVIPNPWDLQGADVNQNFEGSPMMNPYPESLPDSVQTVLADRYQAIFE